MRGALMVCGTGSDVGKSRLVTGICRALRRRGVAVAPFKGQNMALNSTVTACGGEIARAQAVQAAACGIEAEVAMNPVLLKPTGERASQVVVMGRAVAEMDAAAYHGAKRTLGEVVLGALADLRSRYDVVVCEGAGGAAEINLLGGDIVNLWIAKRAELPALVVADIDRGGAFASLYGTWALLPDDLRATVRGFVVNKFRGDPALLGDGPAALERRCGVPTFGVVPYVDGLTLDAEDSLALGAADRIPAGAPELPAGPVLDVAVVRLPRIANFTDLDPLRIEPSVRLSWVGHPSELVGRDLIVVPGSKTTVGDLSWMRERGLDAGLRTAAADGAAVLGICGGYQMLGARIVDEVESRAGTVEGLGLLPVETRFAERKITRRRAGTALGHPISGYEIRHGRPRMIGDAAGVAEWLSLDPPHAGETDLPGEAGLMVGGGRLVMATSLHGILECDGFRAALLRAVAGWRGTVLAPAPAGPPASRFAAVREVQIERLADLVEDHLDMGRVLALAAEAG